MGILKKVVHSKIDVFVKFATFSSYGGLFATFFSLSLWGAFSTMWGPFYYFFLHGDWWGPFLNLTLRKFLRAPMKLMKQIVIASKINIKI